MTINIPKISIAVPRQFIKKNVYAVKDCNTLLHFDDKLRSDFNIISLFSFSRLFSIALMFSFGFTPGIVFLSAASLEPLAVKLF